MKQENAINFLLYSYLGITLESEKSEILDAAISRAYRDASSHVLSVTNETNKHEEKDGKTMLLADAAKSFLQNRLDELPSNSDYNDWFYTTCIGLKNVYKNAKKQNGNNSFSLGHAQKWVNMTMKYLCVIKSVFMKYDKEILLWLDELENQLHIPVDSYILQAAWETEGTDNQLENKKIKFPLNKNNQRKDGKSGTFSDGKNGKVAAWSTWDFDEKQKCEPYSQFQSSIRKYLTDNQKGCPIDWEGSAWIEIAKKRNSK